jgi:hypothetical protein
VRARLIDAAGRTGRARRQVAPPAARRAWWQSALGWRLAGAAVVIAIVGVTAGAWWATAARPDSDADHLADAVMLMSTLASDSAAHEVVLRDAAGSGSGVAVMSGATHQLAVFAMHLPSGGGYHCYLEHGGRRTWIGHMYVAEQVQFWAGDMDADVEMQPGDVLVVAADENAPAALSAIL